MTQSFKVFNPFKKLPILFESKGNCKVMLTKIKELVSISHFKCKLKIRGLKKQIFKVGSNKEFNLMNP